MMRVVFFSDQSDSDNEFFNSLPEQDRNKILNSSNTKENKNVARLIYRGDSSEIKEYLATNPGFYDAALYFAINRDDHDLDLTCFDFSKIQNSKNKDFLFDIAIKNDETRIFKKLLLSDVIPNVKRISTKENKKFFIEFFKKVAASETPPTKCLKKLFINEDNILKSLRNLCGKELELKKITKFSHYCINSPLNMMI